MKYKIFAVNIAIVNSKFGIQNLVHLKFWMERGFYWSGLFVHPDDFVLPRGLMWNVSSYWSYNPHYIQTDENITSVIVWTFFHWASIFFLWFLGKHKHTKSRNIIESKMKKLGFSLWLSHVKKVISFTLINNVSASAL